MKTKLDYCTGSVVSVICALALMMAAKAGGEEVKLKLLSSGAVAQSGGYVPQRLTLSDTKPASLKHAPEGLEAPLYGELKLGPKESPTSFLVILDEPAGKPARLWVDANANGDLTDDPAVDWKPRTSKSQQGKELTMYAGTNATLKLTAGAETMELRVNMYRFDKTDPARAALADSVFYYGDYARVGDVTLGGKTYKAMLTDNSTAGDFRATTEATGAGTTFLVDFNGDGKFDRRREGVDVNKPFNIAGTTYEIHGLAASGATFQVEKSKETAEEMTAPPNLAVGQKSLPFDTATTDGKTVKFPGSHKGKLVMLDFWATWCPPCRAEIPGLVAAYNKYHGQGFDVLGISLDKKDDGEKLAKFTKDQKMPWPQIFDGKFWTAQVAVQYDVHSIPAAFLVDGDTGVIIAAGNELRGEKLEETLEKALAARKKGI